MEFVVSDMHFYHENIIGFDGRPFNTVNEMNQTLIDNWNAVVHTEDTVYILGDMFFRANVEEVENVLSRLNGKKIYIFGNHEKLLRSDKRVLNTYFESSHEVLNIKHRYNGRDYQVYMSHYPVPMYDGHFREKAVHLYGHVHKTTEQLYSVYQQLMNFANRNEPRTHKMLNVGVMMKYMGYEPKTLSYVIEKSEIHSDRLYRYYNEECGKVMPTLEEFRKQEYLYLY